jgi:hypothetical protein
MKKIPLLPYHGHLWSCESHSEMVDAYLKLTGDDYPYPEALDNHGRYIKIDIDDGPIWLVYAITSVAMAHEVAHVLLKTFDKIGHNPTQGDGEPFCYMLSHLMNEAGSP